MVNTFLKTGRLILAVLLMSSMMSQAWANQCDNIFSLRSTPQKLVESVITIAKMEEGNGNNTTGLRQELKITIPAEMANKTISELQAKFKESFKLRDKTEKDKRNVTYTSYLKPITFIMNGRKLNAKVRFRKYFSAPINSEIANYIHGKNPDGSVDVLRGKQFVELKVQHEVYENTVYKPRFIMNDDDVNLMQTSKEFIKNRDELIARTLEINKKENHALIKKFFEVFDMLAERGRLEFEMDLTTAYVREAWSLSLQDKKGNPVDIQFTFDREIVQKMGQSDVLEGSYDPRLVVAEVKIPVKYSQLSLGDLMEIPGLESVVTVIKSLKEAHNPNYEMNRGKRSHAVFVYNERYNVLNPGGNSLSSSNPGYFDFYVFPDEDLDVASP